MITTNEIKQKIKDYLKEHREEFLDDLAVLISIPSVEGDAEDGKPFGKNCADALEAMLKICEKYGFETKNFENYAGTAVFKGQNDFICLDILSHLDVVAEGLGWNTKPFALSEKGEFIYGRGVIDDKGPALATLYAARALKELGILPQNSIKLIFGCAEETGSADLRYYFKTQKSAPYTFTPDANFPIYNGEKGRYCAVFSTNTEDESGARVVNFMCGNAPNIVPEIARCTVYGISESLVKDAAASLEQELSVKYETELQRNGLEIICRGKSAHAAAPHAGVNALTALIRLIVNLPLDNNVSFDAFKNLDRLLPHGDVNGENVGIYMKEDISGVITVAFSMLHYDGKILSGVCDMRLPFCATEENCKDVFDRNLSDAGFEVTGDLTKPHYVDKDGDFVKALGECFEFVTGRKSSTLVTGGGTYVHNIEGGVAFGADFGDYEANLHGANECVKINDLLLASEIYAVAMLEVADKIK